MAIVKIINPRENTALLLWKISEDVDSLKKLTDNVYDELTPTPRNSLHWLASRATIKHHFPLANKIVIVKDAYNKPSLLIDDEPYFISITHSFQYAAVLISKHYAVAVDLEKVDDRVVRVANKFMNPAEDEMIIGSLNHALDLTRVWSSKETLYKMYGLKELDFKQHMTVFINNLKQLRGCVHKVNPTFYEITHELIDGYVLTYIVS